MDELSISRSLFHEELFLTSLCSFRIHDDEATLSLSI